MRRSKTFHFKKAALAMLFFALVGATAHAQITGDTYAAASSRGSGTIKVTYVETPGFVYRQGSELTGVCVAILNDFAAYVKANKGINLSIDYVGNGASFSSMYNQAKSGRGGVLGIGNITITEARTSEITFTPYFIENKAILITRKGAPSLSEVSKISQTFAGMTAYTAKGTLNEGRIMDLKQNHWSSMPIQYVGSSPDVLAKVMNDPKGFAYIDLLFFVDAIKTGKPIQRHATADDNSEQFGFIMPKGSDWAPIWEEFFNAGHGYRNTTGYTRILYDHLGAAAVKLIQATN